MNMAASSPMVGTPNPVDRFRVAEVDLFPAGNNVVLVSVKYGSSRFLPALVVDLLVHCREFRTLDEHLGSYWRDRRMNAAVRDALRTELRKLAQTDFLISRDGMLGALKERDESGPSSSIASVGFPTGDRGEVLRRGVASYIENGLRFGRSSDFVVMDDSAQPQTREAHRRMLRELKRRYGVNILYAGLEEKLAFAGRLAEAGNLPEEAVRFACLGDKQRGVTTVGANRNALLLHTVGELVFSADDDTVCRIGVPPDQSDGMEYRSLGGPKEYWFFPDREAALGAVEYAERDILALHEQWLGREPLIRLLGNDPDGRVSLDQAEPQFLRKLKRRSGKVALTLNGTVGDCGWDNPHFHLFQHGSTYERLTRSEHAYRAARASRELIQAANHTTITERAEPMLAMCMGLDNRDLLPPFPPVGRGEDVAFGAILSGCFQKDFTAHLPWIVPHDPLQRKSFPARRHVFVVAPNAYLPACVKMFAPGLARTPAERLDKLGQFLEELGRLPKAPFEEFVRWRVRNSMSDFVSWLDERLQNSKERPPEFWAREAWQAIEQARRSAVAPVDELYELDGGREAFQLLMSRFGQVLSWWPQIVATAGRLRTEGTRLAQPV
jgi:hypothetical protein